MLRSIKRAHNLDPNHPDLHMCIVNFILHISHLGLEKPVGEVVKRQTAGIYSTSSTMYFTLFHFNTEFLKKNRNSLPHLLQAAKVMDFLDMSPVLEETALSLITNIENLEGVTLENCTKVLESMRNGDFSDCDAAITDFMAKCHKRFPYATAFRPPETKATTNHQEKENSIKN